MIDGVEYYLHPVFQRRDIMAKAKAKAKEDKYAGLEEGDVLVAMDRDRIAAEKKTKDKGK